MSVTSGLLSYLALAIAVGICARFPDHPIAALGFLSLVVSAVALRRLGAEAPGKRRGERDF